MGYPPPLTEFVRDCFFLTRPLFYDHYTMHCNESNLVLFDLSLSDCVVLVFFASIVILRWPLYLLTLDEKKKTNGAATDVPANSQVRKVNSGRKIGEQI